MTLFPPEPEGMAEISLEQRLEALEIAFAQVGNWDEWRHACDGYALSGTRRRALHRGGAEWARFLGAYNDTYTRLVRAHGMPRTDARSGATGAWDLERD